MSSLLQQILAFLNALPDAVKVITVGLLVFAFVAVLGQLAAAFMVLMERKVLSWFTQRKGPNRVGPWGILQSVADGVKLLFKEDIMNDSQDKIMFTLAPAIFLFPVFALYALVPFWGGQWTLWDQVLPVALPVGLLLVFALSSVSVVGLVLAGWSSNNKYSLLGGMRSAAQAISYEIPLMLSLLGVVLFTGTMNIQAIIEAQRSGFWHWFGILLSPVSFMIFYTASIAEVNRVPFDLPEAESELVSGYNTEYSGFKFAMFFLAEYAALFILSALTAAVFFGGYYAPFGELWSKALGVDTGLATALGMPNLAEFIQKTEMASWMMLKTYVFIYIAMLLRGTLPRLKPDQLMGFSWKFLIPVSLINIFGLSLASFGYRFYPIGSSMHFERANDWLFFGGIGIVLVGFLTYSWFISENFTRKLQARLVR